ncbi:hypothetical protein E1264_38620 [Actinomadura sp. KC216]|uniref:HEAT repeat domain-containing protein n=1 Tax=Actinomadura sp. KC216 TaxID=2530370 RepID=UPI001045D6E4|nr:HEAT repeat domain-containing protein [Actinomadura sp. KC216]TDB76384.1 hypothetical protein E1264_38620 [Actinomadura sp. KC216]
MPINDRSIDLRLLDDISFDDVEVYLRDPEPEVRDAALAAMIKSARAGRAPHRAGDTLAWALADEHENVRRSAAGALRDLPVLYLADGGVAALRLAAARGREPFVREIAAELLTGLREAAADQYAHGLHHGEAHVRVQAVLGLVALHAVGRVAEAAADPAREVRAAVAQGLARIARPEGLPALARLLTDHDPVVRMAALDAAAALGVPEDLELRVVAALLDDPSRQVRRTAAVALAQGDPDGAVPPLIRALRDRTVDVRRAAVRSLEQWAADRPEVLAALTEALDDPDPGVRTQIRWALA